MTEVRRPGAGAMRRDAARATCRYTTVTRRHELRQS
jgi:hypothetical protein